MKHRASDKSRQAEIPTDVALEKSMLGSLLLKPNLHCQASAEDFSLEVHRLVWNGIVEMRRAGHPPSLDGLVTHLSSRCVLKDGDVVHVSDLLDGVVAEGPDSLSARSRILRELRIRRDLMAECETVQRKASDRTEDLEGLLDRVRRGSERLHALIHQRADGDVDGVQLLDDLVGFVKGSFISPTPKRS